MKLKSKILIVEDENRIANFIKMVLTSNQYEVLIAVNGLDAKNIVSSHCPDLVVLDLGLPDMNGIEIIRFIRSWSNMPIIVVSAHMHENEKVEALDAGADDYVTKPFGTSELLARIRTALRHSRMGAGSGISKNSDVFSAGGLYIDYDKRQVKVDDKPVKLTNNEYKLLSLLSMHSGKVLTYDYILNTLWGPGNNGNNQILRVHMANIRHKIEKNPADPKYIFTEIGVGYRLIEMD